MDKPICKFESNEQFQESLRYWQDKLFLNHWIIRADLIPEKLTNDNGVFLEGRNNMTSASNCAYIEVGQYEAETIEKHCEELTLVHELLHCKYAYLEDTEATVEVAEYELLQHQKLHEMARTLLMVKYNIDFDWFKNF